MKLLFFCGNLMVVKKNQRSWSWQEAWIEQRSDKTIDVSKSKVEIWTTPSVVRYIPKFCVQMWTTLIKPESCQQSDDKFCFRYTTQTDHLSPVTSETSIASLRLSKSNKDVVVKPEVESIKVNPVKRWFKKVGDFFFGETNKSTSFAPPRKIAFGKRL